MGAYYSREQKIRVNSNTGHNLLAVDDSVFVQGSNLTVQEVASVEADSQTSVVSAALNGRGAVNRTQPARLQQQPGPQGNRSPVQATGKMGSWYSTEVTSEKHVKVYTPEGRIVYEDDDTKTFRANSPEAAQDMMVKTADSNVELMKASLNGLSKIQRSAAITNNGGPGGPKPVAN